MRRKRRDHDDDKRVSRMDSINIEIVTTLYRKKLGFVELVMIDLLEYWYVYLCDV